MIAFIVIVGVLIAFIQITSLIPIPWWVGLFVLLWWVFAGPVNTKWEGLRELDLKGWQLLPRAIVVTKADEDGTEKNEDETK
jgi:hypothetical protein